MDRYLSNVATLRLDPERCVGCRMCLTVCPHAVWRMDDGKAAIEDLDACMECGACALNCANGAIEVRKGVGCANAIIAAAIKRDEAVCC